MNLVRLWVFFWVKETTEKGKGFFRAMQYLNTCSLCNGPIRMPEVLVTSHPSSALKANGCYHGQANGLYHVMSQKQCTSQSLK